MKKIASFIKKVNSLMDANAIELMLNCKCL